MFGLVLLLVYDSLTVDIPTAFYRFAHAFSWYGIMYAFSNFWVLILSGIIYTFVTKNSNNSNKKKQKGYSEINFPYGRPNSKADNGVREI